MQACPSHNVNAMQYRGQMISSSPPISKRIQKEFENEKENSKIEDRE